MENAYDFQKKLLTVHEKDVRDYTKAVPEDALLLKDGLIIEIGTTDNAVIQTAAADFVDFFAVSMGIQATLSQTGEHSGANVVRIALAEDTGADLGEAAGYKGFLIEIDEGIRVHGYDDRGAAQALFYMEDLMCMEHAPYLKKGEIRKKPMFAPQMIHSGYGMEEWPDEYLMRVAHEGRDAIMVFTTGINKTRVGDLDFNDLIARAAKFGLDVYAYASFHNAPVPDFPQPDEEGAEEYYENLYGTLFKECPGFKGVTLVGEMIEYHSKDPRVSKYLCYEEQTDGPDPRPKSGWFPCNDYPQFLELLKKVIYKYKPDAEIVFWSYNWGRQPEDARVELIRNLPKGVTLEATFEMFESWKVGDASVYGSDYTVAFPGPGKYFASEAIAAKECGVPMYAMSQSAGVTWDFGVIPYEPMPYQWMKRYEAMRKAKENWNLLGGMDCHHHGFYPSLITKFSKHAFLEPAEPMDVVLNRILAGEYGEENLEKMQEAFRLWSDGIAHYTPTHFELQGASRNGPAYPLFLFTKEPVPDQEGALFGNKVIRVNTINYAPKMDQIESQKILRVLQEMQRLMREGTAVMESIPNKNAKLSSVLNLGKFVTCCVTTDIHTRKWIMLLSKLNEGYRNGDDFDRQKEGFQEIVAEMETVIREEIANAEAALPLVDADSRLGWEPSMMYIGHRPNIEWKIQREKIVLEKEIPQLKGIL